LEPEGKESTKAKAASTTARLDLAYILEEVRFLLIPPTIAFLVLTFDRMICSIASDVPLAKYTDEWYKWFRTISHQELAMCVT
jgi:hypothetical protein